MSWLIGIACVVIVIIFWRIFLPLIVIAGIAIGGLYLYDKNETNKRIEKKERTARELRTKILTAQNNASPEGKEWIVSGSRDPASGKNIARIASITSDDGLCSLTVQKRINGNELTGLKCLGIKISQLDDITIKFDSYATSRDMNIKSYSNSDDVYITSTQYEYSGHMSYKEFMNGLKTSKAVAIKVPAAYTFWVRFSLQNSIEAIGQLGNEITDVEI